MEQYILSLDKILSDINEETLTEEEASTIAPKDITDLQEKYDILFKILLKRGGDKMSLKKIKAKALIDNIEINKPKKNFNNMLFCFGIDKLKGIKEEDCEHHHHHNENIEEDNSNE